MERWDAEMDEERLGVVEAKDEDGAVEAAAQRFHVPHAKRHKIIVTKIADQGERKTAQ